MSREYFYYSGQEVEAPYYEKVNEFFEKLPYTAPTYFVIIRYFKDMPTQVAYEAFMAYMERMYKVCRANVKVSTIDFGESYICFYDISEA